MEADMRAQELRTSSEQGLYVVSFIFSAIVWLVVIVTIVGLIYGLLLGFFLFVAHALMIAHIKGNAVKLSDKQLPGVYQKVVEACRKLGMPKVPDAYVMQAGGVLNAFATKFVGRNFIVLYSDLMEACEENGKEMDMIIGHEIGHLALGHLKWIWFLLPARVLPWLWPAYSRAREYSCDRCGCEVAGSLEPAAKGLAILAAGGKYGQQVNMDTFIRQSQDTSGFWTSIYELNASHPFLPKRVAALVNFKNPGTVPAVGRNIFAYPFAPFLGFGAAPGAGPFVIVAIIGILAAVAIPQFQHYRERAGKVAMNTTLNNLAAAARQYQTTTGAWPCSMDDLKQPSLTTVAAANNWKVTVNCQYRLGAIIFPGKNGQQEYRAIYFETGQMEDGTLKN